MIVSVNFWNSYSYTDLTFMRNASVESVVETVALEVYLFGHGIVERIVGEVLSVQLPRKIWIKDVVDLGNSGQLWFGRVGRRRGSIDRFIFGLLKRKRN